jgi:hypothetical protein
MVSSSVGYDPWADINDDGKIDMKDIAYTARLFDTSGDPAKNVTVTNWPTTSQIVVWWDEPVPSGVTVSPEYESLGFCRLHILATANGLTGTESIDVLVYGIMYNEAHSSSSVIAYTLTLTATAERKDITIFVPSETFRFGVGGDPSTVRLTFYLTWA